MTRDLEIQRRLPIGAEVQKNGGAHFRVWAPSSKRVAVLFSDDEELRDASERPMESGPDGYWSCFVEQARAGTHYRFKLESGAFPDPASRFQPRGPHGASRVIDPGLFEWTDRDWRGVPHDRRVVYEMHIGTFTREGTWESALEPLPWLAELGITLLEVMPLADFPGNFGWGYDGVNPFAPTRIYGDADGFRRFVDRAHALGMGVIVDVVYNHFGPDGNYLREFSPHYFSDRYKNEWGEALNFDNRHAGPVREYFIANAGYWIDEFHCDGLRLDATQQIFDSSERHIVAEVTARARAAAKGRGVFIAAENEDQQSWLAQAANRGGCGIDAVWNDDFHHSAMVAMTGRREAYYTDYRGEAQEFVSAMKWGYLYQGQRYDWQKKGRGHPAFQLETSNFVTYLENHDQVANSLWGKRIHELTSPGRWRVLTALLLLGPNTPMLFQGQEFSSSAPFVYFADHNPELAKAVSEGRAKFLRQFPSIDCPGAIAMLRSPESRETFECCKLDWGERERHPQSVQLHRDLLRIRRDDPYLGKAPRGTFDGAVLGNFAFVLRFFGRANDDRLMLVNLGPLLSLVPAPEPLLAPPTDCRWEIAWSSESPCYGGCGTPPFHPNESWAVPAETLVLFTPIQNP